MQSVVGTNYHQKGSPLYPQSCHQCEETKTYIQTIRATETSYPEHVLRPSGGTGATTRAGLDGDHFYVW
jgi:hypothetical protein